MIKGYLSPSVTKLEQDNRKLALKAAIEGIVLLENKDDCLPLKERRIALFGAGAKHATKGGTGSGEVNNRDNVSIYDAFISLGYEITSTRWLNDYEQYRKIARKQFITQCKEAIKKQSLRDENACYWAVDPIKEGFPVGRKIDEQDFKENKNDSEYKIDWFLLFYTFVSVLGFSEEFFYKSEYVRIYKILETRNKFYSNTGAGMHKDNEAQALKQLDSFLGV